MTFLLNEFETVDGLWVYRMALLLMNNHCPY